eukprot:1789534-Prymnesium_polylepis.1
MPFCPLLAGAWAACNLLGASRRSEEAWIGRGTVSALVRLVAFEKDPLSHGSGAEAPFLRWCPGVQLLHAVAPSLP